MKPDLTSWFLMAIVAIAIAWLSFALWQKITSPVIKLNKDEWACTKSEKRSHLQPMIVGKVTIMMPMIDNICMEYQIK